MPDRLREKGSLLVDRKMDCDGKLLTNYSSVTAKQRYNQTYCTVSVCFSSFNTDLSLYIYIEGSKSVKSAQ